MGATNIDLVIKGKADRATIKAAFEEQQKRDRNDNGDGSYTGDFQTVDRVDFDLREFASYNEASDYCLEKAEKWVSVVAVYYRNPKGEIDTLLCGWGAC